MQPPDADSQQGVAVAIDDEPEVLSRPGALRSWTTVLSQWVVLWLVLVTLGFVGLRSAADPSADTLATWPLLYLRYLGQLVRGDLGVSTAEGHSVLAMVAAGLPVDLLLTGGALLVAWVIGVAWGLLAAVRSDGALARTLMQLARGFVSLSVVVIVPLFVLLLSATERWSLAVTGTTLWLPMLALALPYAAEIARATHRDALIALASPPVFMARALGLSGRRIWVRHILPAAWSHKTLCRVPLVSVLTSVIVIENLLGLAGTGRFFVAAARVQDAPVVVGIGLVYGTLLIATNMVIELLRCWRASVRNASPAPMSEAA